MTDARFQATAAMADFPAFPGLEGLLGLARRDGIDIRTTLLRVMTDLYVQVPAHPPEEERHYIEHTLRLLSAADVPTRAALAKRLSSYPQAPRAIIARLARDVAEVAEPILKHSPGLMEADLAAIVTECGAAHAEIIAKRGLSTASEEAAVAAATELCELFFAAGGPERRLILMNLDYASAPATELPMSLQRADIWRLEAAALAHNSVSVMRELERALGVSSAQARRIVNDELGEPIVAAAKAMNLPADVLQRVLLFLNPVIGQSIERVYELSTLYSEISVDGARRLIAILRDAGPIPEKTARPGGLHRQHAAESIRRVASEVSQLRAPRREPLPVQRPARATGSD
jgi:hypothetical protein